jgi:hypothetical protein
LVKNDRKIEGTFFGGGGNKWEGERVQERVLGVNMSEI